MEDKLLNAIRLRNNGKIEQSLILMAELLRFDPNNPTINYQMAWTCDLIGKESEAVPYYENAIINGLSGEDRKGAMLGLGSTYRCLGEYEKSLRILEKSIGEFPQDGSLKVFRTLTLHDLGQSKDALRDLLVLLLDTTNDESIKVYDRTLRFYADKLSEIES